MDWIKCRVAHILDINFSNAEIGALYRLQAITALNERVPTDKEINSIIRPSRYKKLEDKIMSTGRVDLEYILSRVLVDCEKVASRTRKNQEYKRKSRARKKNVSADDGTQIREDKIREYNEKKLAKIQNDTESVNSEKSQHFSASQPSFELGDYKGTIDDLIDEIVELRYLQAEDKGHPIEPQKKADLRFKIEESINQQEVSNWVIQIGEIEKVKDRLEKKAQKMKEIEFVIAADAAKKKEGDDMIEKKKAMRLLDKIKKTHKFLAPKKQKPKKIKKHNRDSEIEIDAFGGRYIPDSKSYIRLYHSLTVNQKKDFRIIFKTSKDLAMDLEGLSKKEAFEKSFDEAFESIVVNEEVTT